MDEDDHNAVWLAADERAGEINQALRVAGVNSSRETALALLLLAADSVVSNRAASEDEFVLTARSAYRMRSGVRELASALDALVPDSEGPRDAS